MGRRPKNVITNSQEESIKKIHCSCCGSSDQDNFYMSHSPFDKFFGKLPYCKKCIKEVLWTYFIKRYNGNEQLALHGLLRVLNLPYINSVYLASVKNINNPNAKINNKETEEDDKKSVLVSAYMKNYNSMYARNGYGDTYLDSEGLGEIQGLSAYEDTINIHRKRKINPNAEIDEEKYEVIEYDAEELIYKWGNFDDDKLIKLELEWLDWADKLGDYINDKSVDLLVKQVCQQTVEIQEKRERGEKVKDDITALQGLLNTSGLVEKTQEKNSESVKIGQTIREIENSRPIKECIPELVDVDKYGDLIDTFVGAMSRTLGKENYFTQKFDKLYKEYSMDLDAIISSSEEDTNSDGTENN